MCADTVDIKYVKKLAADRLRGCWGNEIMVFLVNAAIMVLCVSIFVTAYACCLKYGIVNGDFAGALTESPLFLGIAAIIGIFAYLVSAPAYLGSCWWTVHYVRDESKDMKCLLSCYATPRAFFKSLQMKLASDIPCTLLLAAVFGVYALCDMLIASLSLDGLGYAAAAALKWLITLAVLAAVYGLLLRFAAVPYIYCLTHDEGCISNIKQCFRLTGENKQLMRGTAAVFIKSIPIFILVITCIFIFPYCSTLFAAVCVKMTEADGIPKEAADNGVEDT